MPIKRKLTPYHPPQKISVNVTVNNSRSSKKKSSKKGPKSNSETTLKHRRRSTGPRQPVSSETPKKRNVAKTVLGSAAIASLLGAGGYGIYRTLKQKQKSPSTNTTVTIQSPKYEEPYPLYYNRLDYKEF